MTLFAFALAVVLVVLLAFAKKQGTIPDPVRYFFRTAGAFFVGMWNMIRALFGR